MDRLSNLRGVAYAGSDPRCNGLLPAKGLPLHKKVATTPLGVMATFVDLLRASAVRFPLPAPCN